MLEERDHRAHAHEPHRAIAGATAGGVMFAKFMNLFLAEKIVHYPSRDEVARLATSFNHAASRIEALVGAQRTLLAAASHELRSPLTRMRTTLEVDRIDPDAGLHACAGFGRGFMVEESPATDSQRGKKCHKQHQNS